MKAIKPLNEVFGELPLVEDKSKLLSALDAVAGLLIESGDDKQKVTDHVKNLFVGYTRQCYHNREAAVVKMISVPQPVPETKPIQTVPPAATPLASTTKTKA